MGIFLSQLNIAHRGIIASHYTANGQLILYDIIKGRELEKIRVEDPLDFADSHVIGPGYRNHGTTITSENGPKITSFFRSQILPYGCDERTSTIAIELREQHSLDPTESVTRLSSWLFSKSIPHLIERSFRIGRWTLWIFLVRRETKALVTDFTYRLYADGCDAGVIDPDITYISALDEENETIHIPFHFFGGSFFSQLYRLRKDGLRPANFDRIPHIDIQSGDIHLVKFGRDDQDKYLTQLIEVWKSSLGSKKKRAGDILNLIETNNISIPEIENEPSDHSRVIVLGHLLQRLEGNSITGYRIHSRASGNSRVYWLLPIEK